MKIIHFTTVHPRNDIRIRVKQTRSLAKNIEARVALFVQDGQGREKDETGVEVVDTGLKPGSRSLRMTIGAWRMWRTVKRARPDVAHFHDPELIPVGLLLKLTGTKVIYDVHESVPETIMKRDYLPHGIRSALSVAMAGLEKISGLCFDRIVAVTPAIVKRFPRHKTVLVQNFPIKDELTKVNGKPYEERSIEFAYVGGISKERSALEMVKALRRLDYRGNVKLHMAGNFQSAKLEGKMKNTPGWGLVIFHGWANRDKIAEILGRSRAGLVLCYPAPNFVNSQPVKLFEYMSVSYTHLRAHET